MLFTYSDMIGEYGSAYQIGKAVDSGAVFKVARGVYSDERNPDPLAVVCAVRPDAVVTMDSSFYLHGLTDVVPDAVHIATPRGSTRVSRIGRERVRQHFMEPRLMAGGVVESGGIRFFGRERMLVELLRCSAGIPPDYYRELIASYRKIADELDMRLVEDCIDLYAHADSIFDKLQKEVL